MAHKNLLLHQRFFFEVVAILLLLSLSTRAVMAQVHFSGPINYPVGTAPVAAAIGDFNSDGKPDLAVVNFGSRDVSILLGNGDGTFQQAINDNAGSSPTFIALGDFNGDHNLDLAVANGTANTVSVLLGNGDGTFQNPMPYPAGGFAGYVTVADFKGDGTLDLLVSNSQGMISVLVGNGDGTFQPPVITSTNGTTPFVAVGDFNRDGMLDVASANCKVIPQDEGQSSYTLEIRLGNGNGTFQSGQSSVIGESFGCQPLYLTSGDFNADGKADLVLTVGAHTFVTLGNGDGTFGPVGAPNGYGWIDSPVLVADVNNDGKPDLVGLDTSVNSTLPSPAVHVSLGNGDGTFRGAVVNPCIQSSGCISLSVPPTWLAAKDLNADGLPDLVITNALTNSVSVFLDAIPVPGFLLSLETANLNLQRGGQVIDTITIAPQNEVFASSIQLSCAVTGPSPQPTCELSPTSVTLGSNSVTSTLTVKAPVSAADMQAPSRRQLSRSLYSLWLLPMFGITVFIGLRERRRGHWALCGLLVLPLLLYVACGSGNGATQVQKTVTPMSYTVTVTGTSGTLRHTAPITVTVQ